MSLMRLPEEQGERGTGKPVVYTVLGVSLFILVILAVVFASNSGQKSNNQARRRVVASPSPTPEREMEFAEGQEDIEALYKEKQLRAEDLDFWDMYQDNGTLIVEEEPEPSPSPTPSHEPTDEELAEDGEHVQVTLKDGEKIWHEISEDIPLYTYDFTNLKITAGKMEYYQDGEKNSCLGVELSESSGDVDFNALKDSGIDFVMLRLGSRGYESGLIALDKNFVSNITKAQNAGLEVGVYFFSQAVSEKEAAEEAEFVISNLIPYRISYPVAYVMEYIVNDKSRIESLDEENKTVMAKTFLSAIEREGYRTALYGTTDWLLGELVPEDLLADYDVWLNDQSPVPDYPYQFKLWKYAVRQKINGVENEASYIISFVDYTRK